jgi:hypothetical protein
VGTSRLFDNPQSESGGKIPNKRREVLGHVFSVYAPDAYLLPALVQSVIRRSRFLCSIWNNPSRGHEWGEIR